MGTLIKTGSRICSLFFFLLATTAAAAAQSGLAQQMLAETNLARTAPQRYAGYLRDLRRRYQGKIYSMPGTTTRVRTSEGVTALDEAVRYLQNQTPLPPLSWSQGLAESSADLVEDQGPSGEVGHTGSRSGGMLVRIERHGAWLTRVAENIGYGPDTPRLMVMQLIIDDGVPGRGHRKNIFGRPFQVAGAACGPHERYRNMCVMDFAGGFSSSGDR
jgi:uncharacterized protein YkwD